MSFFFLPASSGRGLPYLPSSVVSADGPSSFVEGLLVMSDVDIDIDIDIDLNTGVNMISWPVGLAEGCCCVSDKRPQ